MRFISIFQEKISLKSPSKRSCPSTVRVRVGVRVGSSVRIGVRVGVRVGDRIGFRVGVSRPPSTSPCPGL